MLYINRTGRRCHNVVKQCFIECLADVPCPPHTQRCERNSKLLCDVVAPDPVLLCHLYCPEWSVICVQISKHGDSPAPFSNFYFFASDSLWPDYFAKTVFVVRYDTLKAV